MAPVDAVVVDDQVHFDAHPLPVVDHPSGGDLGLRDTQASGVSAESVRRAGHRAPAVHGVSASASATSDQELGGDHTRCVARGINVPADESQPVETQEQPTSTPDASRLADVLLLIYADALDDFERTRIATENRARALRQAKEMGGTPEEERLLAMCERLALLEHEAELDLRRALRKHPLGPWVKATIGVGEKQGARLLAAIGDPYWNAAEDRARRGPAELWAYCGYHVLHPGQTGVATQTTSAGVDPSDTIGHKEGRPIDQGSIAGGVAPRHARGVRANWNATARMRAHLCAEAAVKAGIRKQPGANDVEGYDVSGRTATTPLGVIYLAGREKYAGRSDATGEPWSLLHQHNAALRLVAKTILRDLWVEGKRLHAVASNV